ncbi:MAG: hypothetical protein IKT03_03160 [Muribaculaceae bacterium]|nr:hypothetical protein [Muribaculaceae bacterium]
MKFEVRFLLQRLFFIGFWLATCTGFVSDLFWGPYEVSPLTTISQLVVDVIVLFLAFCTVRKKIDIILIISLLTIAAISGFIVNDDSIVVWLNGIRYFFPVMFLPPILRYFWATEYRHDLFVKSLDKQLYIFLWLQVPTVLFQFFMYGAGDFVGGTMGGWFSGILSFSIYYTSFYLLNKRIDRNNILQSLYKNWIYIFLLFPTFLNETKISFGLIIAYFVLLLPIDRKYLIRLTFLTPLIVILVGIGSTFYFSTVTGSEKFELSQEFFENYLTADLNNIEGAVEYAEKNYEETFDIPRFAKLELVLMVFNEQPGHNLFGFGLSLYRHGKIVEAADFYNEYDWLMKGTSPQMMSSALQLGIIGSIWYIIFFISLFFIKPYPYIKRNYNMQVYFFLAFVILLFYADYWQYPNFSHVLFLFLFLSWEKDKPVAIQSNVV